MADTLLLRLSGPMQSWGVQSQFAVRDTGREPSKSGVIGLLCAALGRPRSDPLDDLSALRMGVRVDQEGRVAKDYHIAGIDGYYKVGGDIEKKTAILSNRYYLADAIFLVGLEGDLALLRLLDAALHDPVWSLYLGRKAFVPGESVCLEDGLCHDADLANALKNYPFMGRGEMPESLRVVIEDPMGSIIHLDQPVSFEVREFRQRRLITDFIDAPAMRLEEV